MEEIWNPIAGYEGLYEASSLGRIRSVPRVVPHRVSGSLTRKSVIRSPQRHRKTGYLLCNLSKAGKHRTHSVHRLVCEAFHGTPPEGMWVRHLDGDKTNNLASNLSWGTPQENMQDQFKHGHRGLGSRSPRSKLTEDQVVEIRHRRANGEMRKLLAREFNVSETTIGDCVSGKSWLHLGT